DVSNGAVGFLNACQVATQMIGAGKVEYAMVVTSETENNAPDGQHPLLGVQQTGSAVVLRESDDAVGFGRFVFHYDPQHADALTIYTRQAAGKTWLQIDREPKLATHYLDMVPAAVDELLELEKLNLSDIKVVIPPFLAADDRIELANRIGIDS